MSFSVAPLGSWPENADKQAERDRRRLHERQFGPTVTAALLAFEARPKSLGNVIALYRSVGVDDWILGAILVRDLMERTHMSRTTADEAVIAAGLDWPMTEDRYWGTFFADLVDDGLTEDQARTFIAYAMQLGMVDR